jgi:hypothetical protein
MSDIKTGFASSELQLELAEEQPRAPRSFLVDEGAQLSFGLFASTGAPQSFGNRTQRKLGQIRVLFRGRAPRRQRFLVAPRVQKRP